MAELVRVLDYGMGNLRSVRRALEAAGAEVELSDEVGGELLVLPGVGAFKEARRRLGDKRWTQLEERVRGGKATLGICLGMQLMFEGSDEHGWTEGLGCFDGRVESMSEHCDGLTVPNMGWHQLSGLGDPWVYLAHSFGVRESSACCATISHGRSWVAAARRERVWGFQFHPEKSSALGIELLEEWLSC